MHADRTVLAMATIAALATVAPALADFSGQTILGPIGPGSVVSGDLTGSNDNNDGWFSGGPIFGIWDGGDDVWQLIWPGGDMNLTLSYSTGDPDLFLYSPGNLDESSHDSVLGPGPDVINFANAPAGTYYVLIDTVAGFEGPYQLSVGAIPAPGGLALLAGAALAGGRRRRRM